MRADFGPQGDTCGFRSSLLVKGYTTGWISAPRRSPNFSKRGRRRGSRSTASHDLVKDRPFDDFDVNAGGIKPPRRRGDTGEAPSFS
jgi:hypothetical protein